MKMPIKVPMDDNQKFSIEEYRNFLYYGGQAYTNNNQKTEIKENAKI